jgi:hypothetical protein
MLKIWKIFDQWTLQGGHLYSGHCQLYFRRELDRGTKHTLCTKQVDFRVAYIEPHLHITYSSSWLDSYTRILCCFSREKKVWIRVALFVYTMVKQLVKEITLVLTYQKFITLWTKAHCGTVPWTTSAVLIPSSPQTFCDSWWLVLGVKNLLAKL